MANEVLVAKVKQIVGLAKAGNTDAAHDGYRELFSSAEFLTYRPEDQRQVLKLLILQKRSGAPPESLKAAMQSALVPLTELVSLHGDAGDFEMLGLCHLMNGNEAGAANLFREGLRIERDANPQSDLCGRLMTRISAL